MSNNAFPDPMNVNVVSPDPLPVDNGALVTAYGLAAVAELTPRAQITAQYGITENIFTAGIGGTVTNLNSMFQANTGTGASNVITVTSDQQVSYKSGQGLMSETSAIFNVGLPDSFQVSGMISSESLIGFGYLDEEFGVVFATDGALEIQELTITTGAGGAENATITIDGTPYVVPLTNSSINENAFEISESLLAQVPGYSFTSVLGVVNCMALLPELGGGAFTFLSATAVAAFVEIAVSALPTEGFTPKASWNVNPNIDINPQFGNVYKVQFQYLGFGNTFFSIENPDTGRYELVHIHKYANTAVKPSVPNPIFRVGWAARNVGNTTNISVQGGSAALFVEGKYIIHGKSDGECNIQTIPSGSIRNILAIRNRLTFNGLPNRAGIFLKDLSIATESAKITTFYVYKNPITSGFFTWEYEDEAAKLDEFAIDNTVITGGDIVACYQTRSDLLVDLERVINELRPMEYISIAALVPSGASSDVSASITLVGDI
tara:strand:- start:9295 stop:10770 length:1476 start_codon:yes stop_codon:yes gene_type:complete